MIFSFNFNQKQPPSGCLTGCHKYEVTGHMLIQVQGKVTGSFQSGYLADVTVNGFTYQAVLFSPYLALNTPPQTFAQTAPNARANTSGTTEEANPLPALPEGSTSLEHPDLGKLPATKAEDRALQATASGVTGIDHH